MAYGNGLAVGPGGGFADITSEGGEYAPFSAGRTFLMIYNSGASPLQVSFGELVGDGNFFPIAPGAIWEAQNVPPDAIYLACAAGGGAATIFEN
jgi:hypothetical protein